MNEQAIREYLGSINSKFDFEIFDVIDSTNTYAKKTALSSELKKVIIADKQTNGRGRMGRTFYSPEDNGIYMSVVLDADKDFNDSTLLTVATATVVCNAIETVTGLNCEIKWVNDIFVNKLKVCGILAEGILDAKTGKVSKVVIGIGINIKSVENFPEELNGIAGALNIDCNMRECLIAEILKGINQFDGLTGLEEYLSLYREKSMVLNKIVSFTRDGKNYKGKAIDINNLGNLVIELENKEVITVKSGEIRLVVTE